MYNSLCIYFIADVVAINRVWNNIYCSSSASNTVSKAQQSRKL